MVFLEKEKPNRFIHTFLEKTDRSLSAVLWRIERENKNGLFFSRKLFLAVIAIDAKQDGAKLVHSKVKSFSTNSKGHPANNESKKMLSLSNKYVSRDEQPPIVVVNRVIFRKVYEIWSLTNLKT